MPQPPIQVPFAQIAEGEWFVWEGLVGVKVDECGFYPNGYPRGVGNPYTMVTRLSNVTISVGY